jgi:hypothetical protein
MSGSLGCEILCVAGFLLVGRLAVFLIQVGLAGLGKLLDALDPERCLGLLAACLACFFLRRLVLGLLRAWPGALSRTLLREVGTFLPEADGVQFDGPLRVGGGGRCGYCGEELAKAPEDLVHCRTCWTPAHRCCFTENGGCPVYSCSERGLLEEPELPPERVRHPLQSPWFNALAVLCLSVTAMAALGGR